MKKNRIKATASFIVNCLFDENYALLHELDCSQESPPNYIENAVEAYGGAVTLIPDDKTYRIGVIRHADIPDRIFVDILLWFDNQESDLTLQCTFHIDKVLDGLYRFSITELDIL
ncbi:hypothetical protein ACVWYF_001526 [Hymenobacter sp. UYAg731]